MNNGYRDFEEIKIPVPWGFIAGKWWGRRDVQPVIAMHGWQDNAGTFDTLAPLLVQKGVSLLCIDLPGHGFSSHYPEGLFYYVFWDGLHVLRRIVKYFKWEKIKIMGHSLGGAIAFMYAASFPDETDRYVSFDIVSPTVRSTHSWYDRLGEAVNKFLHYETLTIEQMPRYDYEEMIDIVEKAYAGACTRRSCEIMMRRGMRRDGDVYTFSRDCRLKTSGLAMVGIAETMCMAKKIKCRVMNVRATTGLATQKPEYYEGVLDEIEKNAQCLEKVVVEGTHHLHLNDPEKVYEVVAEFLNRD